MRFLYAGDDVAADYAGTGSGTTLSRLYVTPGLDQNLSLTENGVTYYYAQDGIGSVRTLTDATGVAVNRYDYTAFGETYASTGTVSQRYGFQSRELRPVAGGMHFRYRNYQVANGRFDRRDPIGYYAGSNIYSFVNDRPSIYFDPFGLKIKVHGDESFKKKVAEWLRNICPYFITITPDGYVVLGNLDDMDEETYCQYGDFCSDMSFLVNHPYTSNIFPHPGKGPDDIKQPAYTEMLPVLSDRVKNPNYDPFNGDEPEFIPGPGGPVNIYISPEWGWQYNNQDGGTYSPSPEEDLVHEFGHGALSIQGLHWPESLGGQVIDNYSVPSSEYIPLMRDRKWRSIHGINVIRPGYNPPGATVIRR